MGSRGKAPVGVWGQSPPEAEAILDFYMHNFDLSKGKIEKMSKSGGTLYIGVPPLQILGGRVPPRRPKVYASGLKWREICRFGIDFTKEPRSDDTPMQFLSRHPISIKQMHATTKHSFGILVSDEVVYNSAVRYYYK